MLVENVTQNKAVLDIATLQVAPDPTHGQKLAELTARLATGIPWGDRQIAAQRLGNLRDRGAVLALLEILPDDNFWMVRCAIIQALEKIGDPTAIPTLRGVAVNDAFQVVRAYARKAIERIE